MTAVGTAQRRAFAHPTMPLGFRFAYPGYEDFRRKAGELRQRRHVALHLVTRPYVRKCSLRAARRRR
jgi:hypothetical protein